MSRLLPPAGLAPAQKGCGCRHQLGPGNPGCVVGARLLVRVTTASRAVTVTPMPVGYAIALLPDVADRQSRDGFPQRVVKRKHSVIAMPVSPRLWASRITESRLSAKGRKTDWTALKLIPRGAATAVPNRIGTLASSVQSGRSSRIWASRSNGGRTWPVKRLVYGLLMAPAATPVSAWAETGRPARAKYISFSKAVRRGATQRFKWSQST